MPLHFWSVLEAAPTRPAASDRPGAVGYAAGLLGWMIGGSVFVAVKLVSDDMPPWTIVFCRALIAALVLMPLVAGTGTRP